MFNYVLVDIRSSPSGAGTLHVFRVRTQFNF